VTVVEAREAIGWLGSACGLSGWGLRRQGRDREQPSEHSGGRRVWRLAVSLALVGEQPHLLQERQLRPLLRELEEAFPVLRTGGEDPLAEGIRGHPYNVAPVPLDEQELVIARRPRQTPDLLDLAVGEPQAEAESLHRLPTGLPHELGAAVA